MAGFRKLLVMHTSSHLDAPSRRTQVGWKPLFNGCRLCYIFYHFCDSQQAKTRRIWWLRCLKHRKTSEHVRSPPVFLDWIRKVTKIDTRPENNLVLHKVFLLQLEYCKPARSSVILAYGELYFPWWRWDFHGPSLRTVKPICFTLYMFYIVLRRIEWVAVCLQISYFIFIWANFILHKGTNMMICCI